MLGQGGLAGTVAADDGEKLAPVNAEANSPQGLDGLRGSGIVDV
jgi:hypothetical protein